MWFYAIFAGVAVVALAAIGGGTMLIQKKKRKKQEIKNAVEQGSYQKDVKHCSFCGKEMPLEATFCPRCGRQVDIRGNAFEKDAQPIIIQTESGAKANAPVSVSETKFCSYCNYEMPKVNRFCPNCGNEVDINGVVGRIRKRDAQVEAERKKLAEDAEKSSNFNSEVQRVGWEDETLNSKGEVVKGNEQKPAKTGKGLFKKDKHRVGWNDETLTGAEGEQKPQVKKIFVKKSEKDKFNGEVNHVGWDDETLGNGGVVEYIDDDVPVAEEKPAAKKAEKAPAKKTTKTTTKEKGNVKVIERIIIKEVAKEQPKAEPVPIIVQTVAPTPAPQPAPAPQPIIVQAAAPVTEQKATIPVDNTPKKTFAESLTASSKQTQSYYKEIMNYALAKNDARESEAQYAMTVICGRLKLMQVMFQREKLVCKFMAGSSELKKFSQAEKAVKIKEKPVIVEIDSKESVDAAKGLIDIAHKNIQEARNKEIAATEKASALTEKTDKALVAKKEPVKKVEKEEGEKPAAKTPAVKPVAEKKEVAKKEPTKKEEQKKTAVGKWFIEHKSEGEYVAKLAASNGEVMLSSEIYTTEDGAKAGIETIIKNTVSGSFIPYQNKNGSYYYKLKTANNKLLCVGEIYKTKDQCLKSIESVKRIAADAVISEEIIEDAKYVDYEPEKNVTYDVKGNARGKWKIEETEEGLYSAKLYASNGQLMLATEAVAAKATAKKNVELVKKYSADGNFIIDKDKFGRFYYKLRNAQKSVVCIGEAYESKDACISALESVRRFAAIAEIVEEEAVAE